MKIVNLENGLLNKEAILQLQYLTFEEVAEFLENRLGNDFWIYEGNNHLAVHKEKDKPGKRLIFITRK